MKFFLTFIYTFQIYWRLSTGRWFVFRDMPNWYVEVVASMKSSDNFKLEFIEAAKEEYMMRLRSKK